MTRFDEAYDAAKRASDQLINNRETITKQDTKDCIAKLLMSVATMSEELGARLGYEKAHPLFRMMTNSIYARSISEMHSICSSYADIVQYEIRSYEARYGVDITEEFKNDEV